MASEPLRIAYLCQHAGISLDDYSGPAVHINAIVTNLRKSEYQVTFVGLRSPRSVICAETAADEHEARLGLTNRTWFRLLESAVRRGQRLLRLPYLALFDSLRFYDACIHNLQHCDVLHERFTRLSIGGVAASRRMGIPLVLEVNADILDEWDTFGQSPLGLVRLAVRWTSALCFRWATKIVAVSDPLKSHLVQAWGLPADKVVVLPNGTDVDQFRPAVNPQSARQRLKLEEAPTVVFVSGFYPWHASFDLIESFARVHQQFPSARLLMVGDGQTRAQTEDRARQLGLETVVSFVGVVPHEHIADWLAAADVAVVPYPKLPKEVWFSPLKLYEYMAAGKAIVASRAGQVAQVLTDCYTGLLVDPGDHAGFAQALIHLLNDETERDRLGRNARRQAVEQHSWAQYVRQLGNIYADVLRTAPQKA